MDSNMMTTEIPGNTLLDIGLFRTQIAQGITIIPPIIESPIDSSVGDKSGMLFVIIIRKITLITINDQPWPSIASKVPLEP